MKTPIKTELGKLMTPSSLVPFWCKGIVEKATKE